jgi:hypothetical protein
MSSAPSPPNRGKPQAPFDFEETPSIRPPRSAATRKPGNDSIAFWIILGLVGFSVGAYAIYLAKQPARTVTAPPTVIVVAPAQPPAAQRPERRARAVSKRADSAPAPTPAVAPAETTVEVVKEEPQAKPAAEADPTKAFDSGSLFDQPTSRDRHGRPGSTTFDNPAHGRVSNFENPPQGPTGSGMRRAPNPAPNDRPNAPDPSFRNPN